MQTIVTPLKIVHRSGLHPILGYINRKCAHSQPTSTRPTVNKCEQNNIPLQKRALYPPARPARAPSGIEPRRSLRSRGYAPERVPVLPAGAALTLAGFTGLRSVACPASVGVPVRPRPLGRGRPRYAARRGARSSLRNRKGRRKLRLSRPAVVGGSLEPLQAARSSGR